MAGRLDEDLCRMAVWMLRAATGYPTGVVIKRSESDADRLVDTTGSAAFRTFGTADERLGVEPVGWDVNGPPDDALRVLSHRGAADLLGFDG